MSLQNPTGKLHPHERQFRESWTLRWFKLTGIHPVLVEGKRTTTSVRLLSKSHRSQTAMCNPNPEHMRPHTPDRLDAIKPRPRAMMPDKRARYGGLEL